LMQALSFSLAGNSALGRLKRTSHAAALRLLTNSKLNSDVL
jgi:hypothetical protein